MNHQILDELFYPQDPSIFALDEFFQNSTMPTSALPGLPIIQDPEIPGTHQQNDDLFRFLDLESLTNRPPTPEKTVIASPSKDKPLCHCVEASSQRVASQGTKPSPEVLLQLVANKLAGNLDVISSAQAKLDNVLEATRSDQMKLVIKLERQETLLEGVKSNQEKQDVKVDSTRQAQEKMDTRLSVLESKLAAIEASQQQLKVEVQNKDNSWRTIMSSANFPQLEDIKSTQKAQHVLLSQVDACQEAQKHQLTGISAQLLNVRASLEKLAEDYVVAREEEIA